MSKGAEAVVNSGQTIALVYGEIESVSESLLPQFLADIETKRAKTKT